MCIGPSERQHDTRRSLVRWVGVGGGGGGHEVDLWLLQGRKRALDVVAKSLELCSDAGMEGTGHRAANEGLG